MSEKKMQYPEAESEDEIYGINDLPFEYVPVPEWKRMHRVRGLTAGERDKFESSLTDAKGRVTAEDIRAKLVYLTTIHNDGSRFFSSPKKLTQKSAAAVDRLFSVAQRLSGLTNRDVEDLEKNSGGAPSEGLPSD